MRAFDTHSFVKVNEFLSVERDHSQTLRESQASALWSELESVRSRYVDMSGPRHERMMRRHWVWSGVMKRWFVLGLVVQSLLPSRLRVRPWRNLLGSGRTRVKRLAMLLRSVPRVGPRMVDDVMEPSRHWLEPGS